MGGVSLIAYFVSSAGELGTVNLNTGVVDVISRTRNTYTDIAVDPSGAIYGSTFSGLYRLTLSENSVAENLVLGFSASNINALEFSGDGRLFAAGGSNLYQIDIASQSTSVVGRFSSTSAGDIYVIRDDVIVSANNGDLVTLNLHGGGQSTTFDGTPNSLFGLAKTATDLFGFYNRSVVEFDISSQSFKPLALSGDKLSGTFWGASSQDQFLDPSSDFTGVVNTMAGSADGLDTVERGYRKFDLVDLSFYGDSITLQFGNVECLTLTDIERVRLLDGTLAFDIDGNAGQAYRLYQAAFDRAPDVSGLGYWIVEKDGGSRLQEIARNFIGSSEFRSLYGATASDREFTDLLYANVLNRDADAEGYVYWVGQLSEGLSRADMLIGFSESGENKANVADEVSNGIWFV